ncbi:MAG: hypothetical protein LKG86_09355 [Acetobacter fabarum]|jgi:hypothetical protein|nr:hypothetical protein [Acetobacter fabarum]MCH4141943.1 hypothetical protein [Acetobacter fabarum]MCI1393642.1 hypothetical protein [Acetobacter fabarum]MCI1484024.1 hypothetical protein [Acetobacter fabarum]MCI1492642.1 hypothetical protein [Acetobacter fabarum]
MQVFATQAGRRNKMLPRCRKQVPHGACCSVVCMVLHSAAGNKGQSAFGQGKIGPIGVGVVLELAYKFMDLGIRCLRKLGKCPQAFWHGACSIPFTRKEHTPKTGGNKAPAVNAEYAPANIHPGEQKVQPARAALQILHTGDMGGGKLAGRQVAVQCRGTDGTGGLCFSHGK